MEMAASAPFPSLIIRAHELHAVGPFAEAQAEFFSPDGQTLAELDELLERQNVGVVAHFYMAPELQGVLTALKWPHIQISDSLLMADAAINMATAGVEKIIVLGVDFMSENVRAMLDASGFDRLPVYRVRAEPIGCSLAESARADAYGAYLAKAAKTPRSLHVVYINTALDSKAAAHHMVPTITCTSSNVVQTILQAAAQVDDLNVWFGPDTYMGENLEKLFTGLATLDDAAIAAVHPEHDRASIARLLERYQYFHQGVCIVHHMFGADVVKTIERDYPDVFITAHLEVPGEMFGLALAAQDDSRGVVGSTSNILSFITEKLEDKIASGGEGRLRFILGTEAGMITSIVRRVQKMLTGVASELEVEIIFPVASEAVATTDDAELGIVPGVAGGEGCSTAGGCATCPFMKMNSLDALTDLLGRFGDGDEKLLPFFPKQYSMTIGGRTAADLGGEPILHMRHFQRTKELPPALADDIASRGKSASA